jgi:4a-hydroxytetrahydrobiopterin dehydratase
MVEASEISASKGESIEALVSQTTSLVDSGRWKLCNDGKALERQFKFKTFKATWVSTTSSITCRDELLICTQGLHERGSS